MVGGGEEVRLVGIGEGGNENLGDGRGEESLEGKVKTEGGGIEKKE
jgi:hypothetical protein